MEEFIFVSDNLNIQRTKEKKDARSSVVLGILTVLMIILIVLKLFVYETVIVSGTSMYPTLETGDILTVNKLEKVQLGDIIVSKHGNIRVIKRVVGLAGDTIKTVNGVLYRNGERIDENYLNYGAINNPKCPEIAEITVPEGYVFFVGDNRVVSVDCRAYGAVDMDNVIGVVTPLSIRIKDSGFMQKYAKLLEKYKDRYGTE